MKSKIVVPTLHRYIKSQEVTKDSIKTIKYEKCLDYIITHNKGNSLLTSYNIVDKITNNSDFKIKNDKFLAVNNSIVNSIKEDKLVLNHFSNISTIEKSLDNSCSEIQNEFVKELILRFDNDPEVTMLLNKMDYNHKDISFFIPESNICVRGRVRFNREITCKHNSHYFDDNNLDKVELHNVMISRDQSKNFCWEQHETHSNISSLKCVKIASKDIKGFSYPQYLTIKKPLPNDAAFLKSSFDPNFCKYFIEHNPNFSKAFNNYDADNLDLFLSLFYK